MKRRNQRPFFNPGKPLASRSNRNLFPTVFVDTSVKCSGPQIRPDAIVRISPSPGPVTKPYVFDPDQAVLAASQWGSDTSESADKPWLKSWYYPSDAFDPWPTSTKTKCWWCTYGYDWTPFPMPYSFDKKNSRYRVIGMFCGPSCAKAYACSGNRFSNSTVMCAWIDAIARYFFGYNNARGFCPRIPIAPPRELLQDFCGPKGFTIQQYRTACVHGRSLCILKPGWITVKQVIEGEHLTAQGRIFHPENLDNLPRTQDLVKERRMPFAGRGARRLSDFFGKKGRR